MGKRGVWKKRWPVVGISTTPSLESKLQIHPLVLDCAIALIHVTEMCRKLPVDYLDWGSNRIGPT